MEEGTVDLGTEIPSPVFLGFLLKERRFLLGGEYGDWRNSQGEPLAEICSTGDCQIERPPGWIERWDFNRASCWEDEAAAEACLPEAERAKYALYAYRAIPLKFGVEGEPTKIQPEDLFEEGLPPLPAELDLSGYDRLGYDVVEYCGLLNYGCSPLSCNGEHNLYPVNVHCLLTDLKTALIAARAFGTEEPEPGPYIIIEVFRNQRDRTDRSMEESRRDV